MNTAEREREDGKREVDGGGTIWHLSSSNAGATNKVKHKTWCV